jgi:hypothetical protein
VGETYWNLERVGLGDDWCIKLIHCCQQLLSDFQTLTRCIIQQAYLGKFF